MISSNDVANFVGFYCYFISLKDFVQSNQNYNIDIPVARNILLNNKIVEILHYSTEFLNIIT